MRDTTSEFKMGRGLARHTRELADDLLCTGVRSLTGPAVSDGLEFATYLKHLRPGLPVIWGGWHVTFAA
jgi:hypothetical protein